MMNELRSAVQEAVKREADESYKNSRTNLEQMADEIDDAWCREVTCEGGKIVITVRASDNFEEGATPCAAEWFRNHFYTWTTGTVMT